MIKLLLDSGAGPSAHPYAENRSLLHEAADLATGCFLGCGPAAAQRVSTPPPGAPGGGAGAPPPAACCPPSPNALKVVQSLVDAGADVNARSSNGITPVAEPAAPGALYNVCESKG